MILKKLSIITILLAIFLNSATTSTAHFPGQEPYFKINNKFSILYPVLLIPSTDALKLPQDIAPSKYKPNEEISFEILKDKLPFSANTLENSNFEWNFGDNTTASGLINSHTYTKTGSYILEIYINYTQSNTRELLQSTMIHITENTLQKDPKLQIMVNDQIYDKKKGNLKLDIRKDNSYSAELIGVKDATLLWDMSDGKSFKGRKINYKHEDNFLILNPIVRATTPDGFIYDAEVIIENDTKTKSNFITPLILINGVALTLLSGFFLLSHLKNSSSKK